MATIIIFNVFTNLSKQATSLPASFQLPNQPTYPTTHYVPLHKTVSSVFKSLLLHGWAVTRWRLLPMPWTHGIFSDSLLLPWENIHWTFLVQWRRSEQLTDIIKQVQYLFLSKTPNHQFLLYFPVTQIFARHTNYCCGKNSCQRGKKSLHTLLSGTGYCKCLFTMGMNSSMISLLSSIALIY